MNDLQPWELRPKSREDMILEISELVVLTIRKAGWMMSLLVESLHMRKSWPRHIFVTLQGTLCLALLRPRMASSSRVC